jgi:hypothetical protein
LVIRSDVRLGLDFTVHASVYGKVPFLPQGWLLLMFSTTRLLHGIAIRAFVDSGVEPLETAKPNDERFSAVKTIPAQTKPICEMIIDARIKDLNFGPPIASPRSPYPHPHRFLHCRSRWKHTQDRSETVTKVIEENFLGFQPLCRNYVTSHLLSITD